jgi:class 3 adenylate cyclase/tetratricopeptide (TPR) repeat protein
VGVGTIGIVATVTSCGACGAVAAPEARFCASCGQPLVHRGDERRVVTVVFADLVGFTTLAERRDPEQVKNLVDRCFERLAADIADFGGRVDKIVGDGLLAIFGAPVAHEDDAERAVRAALRMQRTLSTWAAEVGADVLRMRVGVNTGEVLVGALRAGGDITAMGDVVNTASRLQTVAEPGTVVVGPDTHAATADAVRYTALGEVLARGREAPVAAWVAEEAIVPPGRRARRLDVPLVGRDQELGLLTSVVDAAVRKGRAASVIVVAEAGMGKTRLVEEVAERAACEREAAVLEGRCVPYGEANVWWPIAESLRSSFGSPVGTAAAETRRLCTERVRLALPKGEEAEVERIVNGLLHLLGEPGPLEAIDPVRAREEVTRSLMVYMDAWTQQRPVIIVLSDLHWADDAVLELIDALAERGANERVVLLATARASLFERWRPAVGRHNQLVMHLDPLDREAAGELLDRLAEDVSDDLRELVLDRSGGNPFFLEELVSLLGEGGRTGVPHTLRGLVSARLDALPADERTVLDDAAILGRRFTGFAVKVMVSKGHGLSEAAVDAALEGLVAKDLLSCDGPADLYQFRSELVREVAYGTLTKAMRVRGHVGVASWIEAHPTGSAADTDRVAHHYATAAMLASEVGRVDGVPSDLAERAVAALDKAVTSAEAAELHRVVLRLTSQALELADEAALEPASRLRFLLARVRASTSLRSLDDAARDLAEAEELAASSDDPVLAAKVLVRKGDLQQKRGDGATAAATLHDAVEAFRSAGDVRGRAEALLAAGINHIFLGEQDTAAAHFNEALDAYRTLGDRRGEGWALQNLAWVAYASGRVAEADARCEDSIAIFTELGDRGGLSWAVGMQAFVRFHQGRFAEADELSTSILAEAEDRGDPWALGMMHSLRASLRLWTGRTSQAIEPAEEAVQRFRSMGDWYGQLLGIGVLGRSQVALGRIDDGFATIDDGLAVAGATTSPEAPLIAMMHVLTSAAQAGRPDRVDTSIEFHEHEDASEIGFHDGVIAAALIELQSGHCDAARRKLEALTAGLGEATGGYAWSALALARAAAGDTRGATEAAGAAANLPTSTYADRAAAATARMLAAARDGDAAGADAALAEARAELEGTEDRLARELLSLAAIRADEALGRPVAPMAGSEVAADSPGWDRAYRLAAGLP